MNDQNSEHVADDEVGTPLFDQAQVPQAPKVDQPHGENVIPVDGDDPASIEEAVRKHHESHGA